MFEWWVKAGVLTQLVGFCLLLSLILKVWYYRKVRKAPRLLHSDSFPSVLVSEAKKSGKPLVSVIMPAYNEGASIERIVLAALGSTDSELVEFIVVDDRSKDNTYEIVRSYCHSNPRLKAVAGDERGNVLWRGKSWACWQGYRHSRGAYLLFMDSDVSLGAHAIESMVSQLHAFETRWLTVGSRTVISCFAEHLFNITLNIAINQALMPRRINAGDLVYAFGQLNLIERTTYEQLGGHRQVGNEVAETQELARIASKQGIQLKSVLALDHAELEWYKDFHECWEGQLKSVKARVQKLPRVLVWIGMLGFLVVQLCYWLLLPVALVQLLLLDSVADLYLPGSPLWLLLLCLGNIVCVYIQRWFGHHYLGYSTQYWCLSPVSATLTTLMAFKATSRSSQATWGGRALRSSADGKMILPREAEV